MLSPQFAGACGAGCEGSRGGGGGDGGGGGGRGGEARAFMVNSMRKPVLSTMPFDVNRNKISSSSTIFCGAKYTSKVSSEVFESIHGVLSSSSDPGKLYSLITQHASVRVEHLFRGVR